MYFEKYNTKAWEYIVGEDIEQTKKEILRLLKEQKVSLAKVRYLFDNIVTEIEENNPVVL